MKPQDARKLDWALDAIIMAVDALTQQFQAAGRPEPAIGLTAEALLRIAAYPADIDERWRCWRRLQVRLHGLHSIGPRWVDILRVHDMALVVRLRPPYPDRRRVQHEHPALAQYGPFHAGQMVWKPAGRGFLMPGAYGILQPDGMGAGDWPPCLLDCGDERCVEWSTIWMLPGGDDHAVAQAAHFAGQYLGAAYHVSACELEAAPAATGAGLTDQLLPVYPARRRETDDPETAAGDNAGRTAS